MVKRRIKNKLRKKMKFERKVFLSSIFITLIPLILSYIIFINDRLDYIDESIKSNLKSVGFSISQSEFIQNKIYNKENDGSVQNYVEKFISNFKDIDIITVCDNTGEKYSHLDTSQIGQIYVGEDKKEVLEKGTSYFSIKEGSMGITLRWLEPIMYNGKQIGFVMVGKYYKDIEVLNTRIKEKYLLLFIIAFFIVMIASKLFGRAMKKEILNMEPYEIATLYNQKKIIINSVKDGIIALDKDNIIAEVNENCYRLFENFNSDIVINKLKPYIDKREAFEMKEFIIQGKKIFITITPILQSTEYLGTVITLTDRKDIRRVAKEITGVDEIIKSLRANIHEFRNNLHVILGLIQIEEYGEAKKYIQNIQQVQLSNSNKFSDIKDSYVRALLLSRELVAKERKVELNLTENSFLFESHGIINSYDLVTILGNLIENALDACSTTDNKEKMVEVDLFENNEKITIMVRDNGKAIDSFIKDNIFDEGISSKGKNRGIGLNLVKNRVELYNGTININSTKTEKIFIITIFKGENLYDRGIDC